MEASSNKVTPNINKESSKIFIRKKFNFTIPAEVKEAIDNLEQAVITDSSLFDCYLEEFRAKVHWNTEGEEGLTEEQGEELIDYYYRRRYLGND